MSSATESTKRPVDEGAVSRNTNDVLMLRVKSSEEHGVIVNKSVLMARRKGTSFTKELEFIEVHVFKTVGMTTRNT